MPEALLEVRSLRTQFFTRAGVVKAVDDVSFHLDPAETLGIVGESGSGKSVTALSVMRLVEQPGRIIGGQVLYQGDDILEMDTEDLHELRGGKISMIFQDPMTSLNPVLTIGFQITEAIKTHLNLGDRAARDRTVDMLERVRIPDARSRLRNYPHEFSGGMRQRVMIAMALSTNPHLLIADEPTTALDVTIQAQVLELMQELANDLQTATMLITHDLGVVAGSCQRVIVMYAGHVVEEAPARTLFAQPAHPYTQALLKAVPRPGEKHGTRLAAIAGQPPNLINLPPGCPFAPRCPKVQPRCRVERPLLASTAANQKAACFYPY